MKSRMLVMLVLAVPLGLSACAGSPAEPVPPAPRAVPMVGGDRDAQGCKPSAGYSWCARTARCERPWELAARESLAAGPEAFAAYCALPQP